MKSSVSLSAHQKLCVAVAALALGSTAVWESTTTAAGASTASAMDVFSVDVYCTVVEL